MFYESTSLRIPYPEHQGQQGSSISVADAVGNIRSRTALPLIGEWALQHGRELEANWRAIKAGWPLERIEPLD